ncbi:MAG TPA: hypothetical protein VHB50_08525 [Bryobacteraceae bacterium]|nr:hypothetical protein [Bryobacteraceae bacterium]
MQSQEHNRIAYVRMYLNRPGFHLTGTDLRVFSAMGDRVAASISAELNPAKLREQFFLQKVLAAVCASLECPDNVESKADRIPIATRALLRDLMADAGSNDERSRIRAAMDTIEKETQ